MKTKKVLFIGRGISADYKIDGGEYGARRVYRMVETATGIKDIEKLVIEKPTSFQRIKNMLLFQSYGHTKILKKRLKNVDAKSLNYAFFNGSIYGSYVKLLSKKGVKTITFYHNIEHNFYLDKFKVTKNPMDLFMYLYIWYNERLCTKYSNYTITLNQRDSNELNRVYGKEADVIIPSSYDNSGINYKEVDVYKKNKPYLLFVGGNFFANIDGITGFIKNALPRIDMDLWIVGNCCESLEKWINEKEYPTVKLKGFVNDLSDVYREASAVVCPIYSGSGMKTKTVEALKFGKYIFGTKEAFEGIEGDYNKIGSLCNNNNDFIESINNWKLCAQQKYNKYSFDIFSKYYSDSVVFEKFKQFLKDYQLSLGE